MSADQPGPGRVWQSNGASPPAPITRFQFHDETVGDCQLAHEGSCPTVQQRLDQFDGQPTTEIDFIQKRQSGVGQQSVGVRSNDDPVPIERRSESQDIIRQ